MSNRDELATLLLGHGSMGYGPGSPIRCQCRKVLKGELSGRYELFAQHQADAILAAGYVKPRTIGTVEDLDALPPGSVVLSDNYLHHAGDWRVAFQCWDDGLWHRGGRSAETHPDYFLPATVLYEPAP